MEKWFVMRKGAPFQEIAEKFQIHPILARLIRNRDVIGDEAIQLYLNGTIADLYDGMLMKDMDKAVDILQDNAKNLVCRFFLWARIFRKQYGMNC